MAIDEAGPTGESEAPAEGGGRPGFSTLPVGNGSYTIPTELARQARRDGLDGEALWREWSLASARAAVRDYLDAQAYQGSSRVDWDEYASLDDGSWLVPGLIGRGTTNVLTGASQAGKTFLTVDLIASGVFGQSWLGVELQPFRTLVYLSEGVPNYVNRYRAWVQAHGVDFDPVKRNVRVMSGANLASETFQSLLAAEARDFEPDLIVFDTFSGTSGVGDENDAASTARLIERTRQSAEGAAVMFVHHPTKESERGARLVTRGSGVLKNNVDGVLVLVADKDYPGDSGPYSKLTTLDSAGGKVKDAAPVTIRGLYREEVALGRTPAGVEVSSCVMRRDTSATLTKADEVVTEFLTESPMSASDFYKAAGISRATAYRYLQASPYAHDTGSGWVLTDPGVDVDAILGEE